MQWKVQEVRQNIIKTAARYDRTAVLLSTWQAHMKIFVYPGTGKAGCTNLWAGPANTPAL
ncbi:hypothetical protein [Niastella caeni]|uniref:hypothetical protein n=1 Tax=Niastella caeni TaxID=2569763 RepID=UPI001FB6BAF0|nr:hypothetical protein [Niastella caeni]